MSYNFKDKQRNIANQNLYLFAKTCAMFEWENLPETIPYKELEKLLQMNGYAFITEVDGELYAFNGGLGGVLDVYNNPTEITISNPALNFNKTLSLKDDGVLIINDDFKLGLTPLFNRYNTFLVENDINMMLYGYNSRTQKLISASDDKTKQSAELVVKKSIDGEISIIGESVIFDGVKVHAPASNSGVSITNLTEFHQYIKGSLYNEIGLTANFNMKRERLTSGETEQDDANFPLVYNMLKCRMKAVELLNAKYNLNLNVDFGSVWAKKSKQVIDDIIPPENNGVLNDESNPNNKTVIEEDSNSSNKNSGNGDNEEQSKIDQLKNDSLELIENFKDENASESDLVFYKELRNEFILDLEKLLNDSNSDEINSLIDQLKNAYFFDEDSLNKMRDSNNE